MLGYWQRDSGHDPQGSISSLGSGYEEAFPCDLALLGNISYCFLISCLGLSTAIPKSTKTANKQGHKTHRHLSDLPVGKTRNRI